ncbi:inactive peptidyl-prolyl cis-trans isomerase FKBP6-like [Glandiceps talaboti]
MERLEEIQSLSIEDEELLQPPSHTVQLKKGIDLNELSRTDGEGTEFEIASHEIPPQADDDKYFDSEDIFKQLNYECSAVDDDSDSDAEDLTPFEKMGRDMADLTGSEGVLKKMIKGGMGETIPPSSYCKIHYNGYLEYSDEPYDSTRLRNKPQTLKLGEGMCIPGLEIAVASMRKGEFSRFLVKPEYGYGKQGCPPRIPGNTIILFEIELLSFIDNSLPEQFHRWSKEEQRNASFDEILAVVHADRQAGNELFKEKHTKRAFGKYNEALQILENCHLKDEIEEKAMQKVLLKLYLNMALCSIKLCRSNRAITFSKKALEIDEKNVKALFRCGKAYHQLSEFDRAKEFLLCAQKVEPQNGEITRELQKLDKSVKKFKALERDMYGKMFAGLRNPNKGDSENTAKMLPKDCSSGFQKTVADAFRAFIDSDDVQEMPFSMAAFTTAEMDYVTYTANQWELDVKYMGPKTDRLVKISKKKMAEP